MYVVILVIHIVTMIASMALMSGAVALGLFGKTAAVRLASIAMGATTVGFASGLLLMFGAPLTIKCALLTGYLVAVTALYYYGYGFGDAAKARFVRVAPASQQ